MKKIIAIFLVLILCTCPVSYAIAEEMSATEAKTIGILGGMGPLATTDLMRKIIAVTDAKSDNEHVRVYVDSNTSIPDRTEAILHDGPDPVPELSLLLNKPLIIPI